MNYDKIEPANPTRDRFIVCKIYNSVVHEAKRLSYNDLSVHSTLTFCTYLFLSSKSDLKYVLYIE